MHFMEHSSNVIPSVLFPMGIPKGGEGPSSFLMHDGGAVSKDDCMRLEMKSMNK